MNQANGKVTHGGDEVEEQEEERENVRPDLKLISKDGGVAPYAIDIAVTTNSVKAIERKKLRHYARWYSGPYIKPFVLDALGRLGECAFDFHKNFSRLGHFEKIKMSIAVHRGNAAMWRRWYEVAMLRIWAEPRQAGVNVNVLEVPNAIHVLRLAA